MSGNRADEERGGRGSGTAFTVLLLALALLLVTMAVANLGRGIRAATADGTPGMFTATSIDCVQHPGHESCTCYGDYRSHDDAIRREEVYLYGADRETCLIGRPTAAVDIGAAHRVYGPDGSREWMFAAALLLAGLGLGTRAVVVWTARYRRGRS